MGSPCSGMRDRARLNPLILPLILAVWLPHSAGNAAQTGAPQEWVTPKRFWSSSTRSGPTRTTTVGPIPKSRQVLHPRENVYESPGSYDLM